MFLSVIISIKCLLSLYKLGYENKDVLVLSLCSVSEYFLKYHNFPLQSMYREGSSVSSLVIGFCIRQSLLHNGFLPAHCRQDFERIVETEKNKAVAQL